MATHIALGFVRGANKVWVQVDYDPDSEYRTRWAYYTGGTMVREESGVYGDLDAIVKQMVAADYRPVPVPWYSDPPPPAELLGWPVEPRERAA
jgi:hypothetical protein